MKRLLIALTLAAALASPAAASCRHLDGRERTDCLLRTADIAICARTIVHMSVLGLGLEMRLSPNQLSDMMDTRSSSLRAQYMAAVNKVADDGIRNFITGLISDDPETRAGMLKICADGIAAFKDGR